MRLKKICKSLLKNRKIILMGSKKTINKTSSQNSGSFLIKS